MTDTPGARAPSSPVLENYIGGEFVASTSTRTLQLINPVTGEEGALAPVSNDADVNAAMDAAAAACVEWGQTAPSQRQAALLGLAGALEANAEALVEAQTRNTGQPKARVMSEEIGPSADQMRFFAGAARVLEGRAQAEYLPGLTSSVRREPIGVVAQVTPWNYPLMMAIFKIAPARTAGNTIVLKPSGTTPESTLQLAELTRGILPPSVLNIVMGDAGTGRALVEHRVPGLVSITGSVRAGIEVAISAATQLERAHLELGGTAPLIVFADADLDAAGFINRLPAHARVVTGGSRIGDIGYFVEPAIVAELQQQDELVQCEVFGPIIGAQTPLRPRACRWPTTPATGCRRRPGPATTAPRCAC